MGGEEPYLGQLSSLGTAAECNTCPLHGDQQQQQPRQHLMRSSSFGQWSQGGASSFEDGSPTDSPLLGCDLSHGGSIPMPQAPASLPAITIKTSNKPARCRKGTKSLGSKSSSSLSGNKRGAEGSPKTPSSRLNPARRVPATKSAAAAALGAVAAAEDPAGSGALGGAGVVQGFGLALGPRSSIQGNLALPRVDQVFQDMGEGMLADDDAAFAFDFREFLSDDEDGLAGRPLGEAAEDTVQKRARTQSYTGVPALQGSFILGPCSAQVPQLPSSAAGGVTAAAEGLPWMVGSVSSGSSAKPSLAGGLWLGGPAGGSLSNGLGHLQAAGAGKPGLYLTEPQRRDSQGHEVLTPAGLQPASPALDEVFSGGAEAAAGDAFEQLLVQSSGGGAFPRGANCDGISPELQQGHEHVLSQMAPVQIPSQLQRIQDPPSTTPLLAAAAASIPRAPDISPAGDVSVPHQAAAAASVQRVPGILLAGDVSALRRQSAAAAASVQRVPGILLAGDVSAPHQAAAAASVPMVPGVLLAGHISVPYQAAAVVPAVPAVGPVGQQRGPHPLDCSLASRLPAKHAELLRQLLAEAVRLMERDSQQQQEPHSADAAAAANVRSSPDVGLAAGPNPVAPSSAKADGGSTTCSSMGGASGGTPSGSSSPHSSCQSRAANLVGASSKVKGGGAGTLGSRLRQAAYEASRAAREGYLSAGGGSAAGRLLSWEKDASAASGPAANAVEGNRAGPSGLGAYRGLDLCGNYSGAIQWDGGMGGGQGASGNYYSQASAAVKADGCVEGKECARSMQWQQAPQQQQQQNQQLHYQQPQQGLYLGPPQLSNMEAEPPWEYSANPSVPPGVNRGSMVAASTVALSSAAISGSSGPAIGSHAQLYLPPLPAAAASMAAAGMAGTSRPSQGGVVGPIITAAAQGGGGRAGLLQSYNQRRSAEVLSSCGHAGAPAAAGSGQVSTIHTSTQQQQQQEHQRGYGFIRDGQVLPGGDRTMGYQPASFYGTDEDRNVQAEQFSNPGERGINYQPASDAVAGPAMASASPSGSGHTANLPTAAAALAGVFEADIGYPNFSAREEDFADSFGLGLLHGADMGIAAEGDLREGLMVPMPSELELPW